jgi:cytochrome b subunit of formate dehydrogenase
MITGLIMTFHLGGAALVAWAMVLHFFAVGMVVSGLMIHVYMGAVFPEERPAFYSMITGMVNELYAYRHHFTWWRELKMQQREWERQIETESHAEDARCDDMAAREPGDEQQSDSELSPARGNP